MDKQLTLKDIYELSKELLRHGEDLNQYQIYLGDDEELNGIHNGWYTNLIDKNNEADEDLIEMIEENSCIPLKNKGILIS